VSWSLVIISRDFLRDLDRLEEEDDFFVLSLWLLLLLFLRDFLSGSAVKLDRRLDLAAGDDFVVGVVGVVVASGSVVAMVSSAVGDAGFFWSA